MASDNGACHERRATPFVICYTQGVDSATTVRFAFIWHSTFAWRSSSSGRRPTPCAGDSATPSDSVFHVAPCASPANSIRSTAFFACSCRQFWAPRRRGSLGRTQHPRIQSRARFSHSRLASAHPFRGALCGQRRSSAGDRIRTPAPASERSRRIVAAECGSRGTGNKEHAAAVSQLHGSTHGRARGTAAHARFRECVIAA